MNWSGGSRSRAKRGSSTVALQKEFFEAHRRKDKKRNANARLSAVDRNNPWESSTGNAIYTSEDSTSLAGNSDRTISDQDLASQRLHPEADIFMDHYSNSFSQAKQPTEYVDWPIGPSGGISPKSSTRRDRTQSSDVGKQGSIMEAAKEDLLSRKDWARAESNAFQNELFELRRYGPTAGDTQTAKRRRIASSRPASDIGMTTTRRHFGGIVGSLSEKERAKQARSPASKAGAKATTSGSKIGKKQDFRTETWPEVDDRFEASQNSDMLMDPEEEDDFGAFNAEVADIGEESKTTSYLPRKSGVMGPDETLAGVTSEYIANSPRAGDILGGDHKQRLQQQGIIPDEPLLIDDSTTDDGEQDSQLIALYKQRLKKDKASPVSSRTRLQLPDFAQEFGRGDLSCNQTPGTSLEPGPDPGLITRHLTQELDGDPSKIKTHPKWGYKYVRLTKEEDETERRHARYIFKQLYKGSKLSEIQGLDKVEQEDPDDLIYAESMDNDDIETESVTRAITARPAIMSSSLAEDESEVYNDIGPRRGGVTKIASKSPISRPEFKSKLPKPTTPKATALPAVTAVTAVTATKYIKAKKTPTKAKSRSPLTPKSKAKQHQKQQTINSNKKIFKMWKNHRDSTRKDIQKMSTVEYDDPLSSKYHDKENASTMLLDEDDYLDEEAEWQRFLNGP